MAKAKKTGTALVSMKDIENMYAVDAVAAQKAAPAGEGVTRITANDYTFRVGDSILPDPLNVIVVAESLVNMYYDRDYDPAEKIPPACFAVGEAVENGAELMHAHPTSPNMQGGTNDHDCASCEMNRFGSAEKGKGKACTNTRQLAVVMADDKGFSDGSELKWAILSISPTGLQPWGKFVAGLANIVKRPPHGVVTQFSFNKSDPVEQRRKAVVAIGYKTITDVGVAQKVLALRKQILESKALLRPIPVGDYVPPGQKPKKMADAKPAAKAKKKSGKK